MAVVRGMDEHSDVFDVSVPFTRGTPPWPPVSDVFEAAIILCFSPLHEGDTSVARGTGSRSRRVHERFSPLHEGDTSVAPEARRRSFVTVPGFSPLHEGDTSVALHSLRALQWRPESFSPLHEGDTSVAIAQTEVNDAYISVSVPFTRGTPPWRCECQLELIKQLGFSPLHEGDTSVARRGL